DLSLEEQATIIAKSKGGRGPNDEYLFQTFEHLEQLGVKDSDLEWLVQRVRALS
ncbi:MAG: gamma-glutamylcyclotransferase, partial [Pseudomonadota bacterium]